MEEVEDKIKEAHQLAGQIEQALLTGEWEKVAPQSPRLRKEVGNPRHLYENIKQHDRFDTEKALRKFIAVTRPSRHFSVFYKYGAAIACFILLGIGYYLYPTSESTDGPTTAIPSSAYLVLDDGKQIDLNRQMQIDYKGLKIVNTNERKVSFQQTKEKLSSVPHKLVVPKGTEYMLQLSDGTTVRLNAGSSLVFPSVFDEEARTVELSGEAFFDVVHNGSPFIVKSAVMDVKVLGTTFNMTVYPDDPIVSTTLLTGKVAVTCHVPDDTLSRTALLTPGLQARFQPQTRLFKIDSVDVDEQTAWLRGEFVFEDVSLERIMTVIGRSFALNIVFDDSSLKDITCFISIQRDKGYEEILKIIHLATGVRFKKEGNEIRVYK